MLITLNRITANDSTQVILLNTDKIVSVTELENRTMIQLDNNVIYVTESKQDILNQL